MKALWKGSLNFSLIRIEIELFTATREHAVSFKLLHDTCKKPIHNLHWCTHCDTSVPWEHLVKGLPLGKNKFFVTTKAALQELKPLKSTSIQLTAFIDETHFDPIWSDQHYYALSQKEADPSYALFVTTLETSKKIAIGTIVLRDKEHICAFRPYHGRLLMTTLHYAYEIVALPDQKTNIRFTSEELELAQYLIKKLTKKKISIESFQDTFVERLKKLVTKKQTSVKKVAAPKKKSEKKPSLLASLKKSVAATQRRTPKESHAKKS